METMVLGYERGVLRLVGHVALLVSLNQYILDDFGSISGYL